MKKTLFASALALVFASTTAFAAPAVPPVPAHNAPSQNVTHKKVTHKNVRHKKEAHKNELRHKPVKKIDLAILAHLTWQSKSIGKYLP